MPHLTTTDKIFVAGHRGMVGSAITRSLRASGHENIVTRTRQELDLENGVEVLAFLKEQKPDLVIVAAAKVGGIQANRLEKADFIGRNLAIQQSLIWGSHVADIPGLLFLSSSCVYPRDVPQPMAESALLSAPMEPTNLPYAIAKISGMIMVEALHEQYGRNYFSVLPPNVYGPGDNFDPVHSHVLGALIRRFHENRPNSPVVCWGTGTPRREFLHCDDVADACLFLLKQSELPARSINVGTGTSIAIKDLAGMIQKIVGHTGPIEWDSSMPDGFPEKTMDVTRLFGMGWRPKIAFAPGLAEAYEWFKTNSPLAV